jgi:polysaccharide export outer membrane protein
MYRAVTCIRLVMIIVFFAGAASAQSTVPSAATAPGSSTAAKPDGTAVANQGAVASGDQPTLFTRAKADDELRIGSGDLLEVNVFGAPDYTHALRVAEDGSISLPLIGQVHVAGLTSREVAADVQKRLGQGGYFNNPQVGVFVKEYATQGVSVLGEVQKPGVYPLLGSRTLFDVLSAAQGTTPTAGDRVQITHRNQPQQAEVVKLNYDATSSAQSNVRIFPGDTVIVQRAGTAYVVGDVHKPTGIVMANPNLTVLQAIALAEGTNPNAALNDARIVRKINDGQTEIPLPLKKMLSAQAPDVKVLPDDVIFVPNSALKTGFKHGMEAAIATVTGVIIYHR